MPSPTHATLTASDPPLLRAAVTPFPFLLVQYFPRWELGERFYLTQSTQGQQGWDLRVQRFTLAGIFAFGQLPNQNWVLCKEKISSLASEEQCCYSSPSQAVFRNSTEQMQNSTSTGQSTVSVEFSLAHVWFGSPLIMTHWWKQNARFGSPTGTLRKEQYLGVAWRIWTPEWGTCPYTNPHYSYLSPQSCTFNRDRSARWNILVSYHTCALIHISKLLFFFQTKLIK